MRRRLLLISPVSQSSLIGKHFSFRLPCLGLLKVAALTPGDWEVCIVDEKVEELHLEQSADLVGITAMTPTAMRAYEIADHFRRRGTKVIMGGMHPSSLPDEALRHCDSIVIGEAEGLWPTVLEDFATGTLQPIYRHKDGFPPLRDLPWANWDLYQSKKYLPVHFVETTRGCPLDCEFCAVTSAFGGHYRNRPEEEVLSELRSLKPFGGAFTLKNCVFFVDDNLISNRAYARRLLEQIADRKLKWFSHASMNIARDPEILRLCQASGCIGLFIGFESLSQATLDAVGKRTNKPEDYLEAVRKIHDHGIGIDASFVFGFDTDDESVFERTVEFVDRARIEVAFYSILTPYPGTRLHRRLEAEGRLLTTDWRYYDTSHVVYRPRHFTPDQLLEGYFRSLKESYTVRSILTRLWGTTAYKNFFYPMNLGFRGGARRLWSCYRQGQMSIETPKATPAACCCSPA